MSLLITIYIELSFCIALARFKTTIYKSRTHLKPFIDITKKIFHAEREITIDIYGTYPNQSGHYSSHFISKGKECFLLSVSTILPLINNNSKNDVVVTPLKIFWEVKTKNKKVIN